MLFIDETFYLIPIYDTNCRYLVCLISGASANRREPAKRKGSGDGVPITFPMIKSATRMEKIEKKACVVRIAYLFLVGSFCFIFEFPLDSWKDNLVISVVESLLPY